MLIAASIVGLIAVASAAGVLLTTRASPSRRRLIIALSIGVPIAGPVLALLVARVRGAGKLIEPGDLGEARPPEIDVEHIRRIGELPPLMERLLSADSAERQSALVTLAARADAEAIALLRWAVDYGSPEAVLDAALTLGELDLAFERALAAAERAAAERPTYASCLEAGDVLAGALHCHLADPAIAGSLARRAGSWYERAAVLAPASAGDELAERRARLELAAGRPGVAAEHLEPVIRRGRGRVSVELTHLYERARFAARRPALVPVPPRDAVSGARSLSALPPTRTRDPSR